MAISKAIFIHGTGGNPNENWFPWLKDELTKLKIQVFIPQFPADNNQNLETWMAEFKKWENAADESTIMVGHSIGPAFILNFLEKSGKSIAAAFLVSPFTGRLNNAIFDPLNSTFAEREFNWSKIKQHCKAFYVYSSDNDPYVPKEKGEFISMKLDAKYKIIHEGGHINSASGFTKFDLLLTDIKVLLQSDPISSTS